jgi:hypothetical protein
MSVLSAALLMRLQVTLLLGLAGLFIVMPTLAIRLLGLPPASSVWPRLFGGALLGMATAIVAQDLRWTSSGLGIGGSVAINLVLAFTLASVLAVGAPMPTRRGRLVGWLLALAFAGLAFTQIAFAT